MEQIDKKYTEDYKKAVFEGCRKMFEKCVDKSQFEKGMMDKYWDLIDETRDSEFVLHVHLDEYSILDHAHPDFMKKECMEASKFDEFVHQKRGLVNEVYYTKIPIETKDGGSEYVQCDIVFD